MVDDVMPQNICDEQEEWRAIPGLDGYEASSLGRIRSVDREIWAGKTGPRKLKGKIIKPHLPVKENGSVGYYRFMANSRGFGIYNKGMDVQRAVCLAFYGNPPTDEHEAAHLDHDTTNNKVSNLIWATHAQNAYHKVLRGTSKKKPGDKIVRLCPKAIPNIFSGYVSGDSTKLLAAQFGVSVTLILAVLRRARWDHVAIDPILEKAAVDKAKANRTNSMKPKRLR